MLTLVTRPLFIAVTGLIICFNSYAAPNFLQALIPRLILLIAMPLVILKIPPTAILTH